MNGKAATSRRSRGGGGLAWLEQEGGGDAGALTREGLQALSGPPRSGELVQDVPCAHVDRSPFQARRVFPAAALAELQESIRQNGLLQPVVLRPRPGGRYELVAGERRWRVVQSLGWEAITAVIRVVDDVTAHLLGQIENDARADLSAWERALGYVDLRAHVARERGAVPALAKLGEMRGGVDKSTVSRYLTIGEAFSPGAVARAGVSEEDMATLSLPTLLRAARKPEAQRFAMLRDVLRKRRSRATECANGPRRSARRRGEDPRAAGADPAPPAGAELAGSDSAAHGWERYFRERGIRVETPVPVQELTRAQARSAAVRMVPALAALATREAGADSPVPLLVEGIGGTIIFLPDELEERHAQALQAIRAALGL